MTQTVKQLLRKNPEKLTRGEFDSIVQNFRAKRVGYIEARKEAPRLKVANHPEPPQIVSDRALPVEARGGLRKYDHYYPFEDLKPGDSFWVPSSSGCTAGAVTKFQKKSGWKLISRGQAEDGTPNGQLSGSGSARGKKRGTRVWRIS